MPGALLVGIVTTLALTRSLSMFAHSTYPAYATSVAASTAICLLGVLACLVLAWSPVVALLASALACGTFELARLAVAKRRLVAEPFVHGPTILPPAV